MRMKPVVLVVVVVRVVVLASISSRSAVVVPARSIVVSLVPAPRLPPVYASSETPEQKNIPPTLIHNRTQMSTPISVVIFLVNVA